MPDTLVDENKGDLSARSTSILQETDHIRNRNIPKLSLARRDQITSEETRVKEVYDPAPHCDDDPLSRRLESPEQTSRSVINSARTGEFPEFGETGPGPEVEEEYGRPLSPGLQQALMTLTAGDRPRTPVSKKERRLKACETVQHQAFLKCLETVEDKSLYQDYLDNKMKDFNQSLVDEDNRRKEESKHKVKDALVVIQSQMEQYNERKRKEKLERKIPQKPFFLMGDSRGHDGPVRKEKANLSGSLIRDLEEQIQCNRDKKIVDKERKEAEERQYLDHIAMEMDLKNVAERVHHLEKQEALLTAWERDGHMRNLFRLQQHGADVVNKYITKNMSDMVPTAMTQKLSNRKNIGYDPRKSRL